MLFPQELDGHKSMLDFCSLKDAGECHRACEVVMQARCTLYSTMLGDFLSTLATNKAKLHRAVTSSLKQVEQFKLPLHGALLQRARLAKQGALNT